MLRSTWRRSRARFLVYSWEQRRRRIHAMARLDAIAIRRARLLVIDIEQPENLLRRHGHERFEIVRDDAQSFDQVGENLRDARQLSRILRERERRRRHYIFVSRIEGLPDGSQSAIERELLDQRRYPRRYRGERFNQ